MCGNRVVLEGKSGQPWKPIPKMAAHPQDGGPAGRLSGRMDRPLHHIDQLFPESLSYMRWSIREAGVFPWCTQSKEPGLSKLSGGSSRLLGSEPLLLLCWEVELLDTPFHMTLQGAGGCL